VGDSLGMVVQGHEHCLSVTLEEVNLPYALLARGVREPAGSDMPFMTYHVSPQQALEMPAPGQGRGSSRRQDRRGRAARRASRDRRGRHPGYGHIGMTPQSVRRFGGFRVQRTADKAWRMRLSTEKAGAFAVVVECVPVDLPRKSPPPQNSDYRIGAGRRLRRTILVTQDMLVSSRIFSPAS